MENFILSMSEKKERGVDIKSKRERVIVIATFNEKPYEHVYET
jgi:hypothetical protein